MMQDYHINSIFNSVCYRIKDCLIDPGDWWEGFYNVNLVLLTHVHFDHIYGLNELFKASPDAVVYTNESGQDMLLDAKKNMSLYHESPFTFSYPERIRIVKDEMGIFLSDGTSVKAHFTPGHNPSCITWVIDDMVFSGDSLIPGVKTVTNLPGGDKALSMKSEETIKQLALNRTLYPGHKL